VEPARLVESPVTFHRTVPALSTPRPPRRAFERRAHDRAQLIRRSTQAAFVLLNLWIGAQFYAFVRYYETGGATLRVPRPAGVEGWLPIAGLMNLNYALSTGIVPAIHPAALFLLVAFVAMSWLFRKAFCSWLCPIGTISEWLWQGGRELFGRTFAAPRWLDIPLRGLKYLLLGFFLWAVVSMTPADITGFLESPYGVIADVKMLNFFRHLGTTAAAVILGLVVVSVFVKNAWCRYACPYGALLGIVALASPARIRREKDRCTDCGKCAAVCPSLLPVDRLASVKSAECTGCLECVSACPAKGALDLSVGRRPIGPVAVAAGVALIFLGVVALAQLTGHWQTQVPDARYFDLIPNASEFAHPGAAGIGR
jgi:polyferredoxin